MTDCGRARRTDLGRGAQPAKTQQAANGAESASATVGGPAGQVLVGGAGTSAGPMNTYTSRLSGNGGQWQALSILGGVTGPIALDETAVGVCVTIPD